MQWLRDEGIDLVDLGVGYQTNRHGAKGLASTGADIPVTSRWSVPSAEGNRIPGYAYYKPNPPTSSKHANRKRRVVAVHQKR